MSLDQIKAIQERNNAQAQREKLVSEEVHTILMNLSQEYLECKEIANRAISRLPTYFENRHGVESYIDAPHKGQAAYGEWIELRFGKKGTVYQKNVYIYHSISFNDEAMLNSRNCKVNSFFEHRILGQGFAGGGTKRVLLSRFRFQTPDFSREGLQPSTRFDSRYPRESETAHGA